MERQFVNANFKYVRVVPVQNGISWTPEQLCRQIVNSYLAYDYHGDVVVWLDREGRATTAEALRNDIFNALQTAGAPAGQVHVLVNDRMCENVILADVSAIRAQFGDPSYLYTHEGESGKSILKDMYKELGINYKETREGVLMLKRIRLSNCAAHSAAVSALLSTLTQPCWWI